MEYLVGNATVDYAEFGSGIPVVALHGAGVDHRELQAALEVVVPGEGYRRIYPDLPGMGRTSADGLGSNDDVVTLLCGFIDCVADGPVLLLGHSYGGYLARGVAARRPELVRGLALICPIGEGSDSVPAHQVVHADDDAYDELETGQRQGFDDYFVVRTPQTARRYRDHVVPGTTLVDEAALGSIVAGWTISIGSEPFTGPTLIVAGRHDSTVGFAGALALLDRYPRASLAVVEDAGHALMHERPELFGALVRDWLARSRS